MISHRVENYGPWLAALAVGLAFFLFGLAGLYTFHQQKHVDGRLCDITTQNRESTRSSWMAVRNVLLRNIEESPDSEEEKAQARIRTNAFVDAVLRPIPPLECVDNQPVPKEG